MRRAALALAFLIVGAGVADAQMTKAIDKAKGAAAAADAHIAKEQNVPVKAQAPSQGKQKPAAAESKGKAGTASGTGTGGKVGPKGRVAEKVDTVPAFVMREAFDYDRGNARDPFVSLLNTSDLRPVLSDLRLIGVLYDVNGHRSVAVMRDQTNKLYRATVGQTLGRMRVAQIKPRTVIFTIEEFGFNRQDSLVLADTTKTRNP